MNSPSRIPVGRGVRQLRDITAALQRRLAERTRFVHTPEVDQQRRNDAFGADRRLGVLHIPKSAGSSVSASLVASLGDRSWSPYDFDPALFGPLRHEPVPLTERPRVLPDPTQLRDYDAASGHYALSTMLVGFDAADIVMLVREPRSRLLSHYEYWRGLPSDLRNTDSTWSVTAFARELDFDEWLLDPRSAYQSDNIVLRTLLDGHPDIPDDDFISPATLATLTPKAVHRALSLGWVDLVERGLAMWDGLASRVGRPLDRPTVNETQRRAELPTNMAALFRDRTVETLRRRTVVDEAIWLAIAERRGVRDPELAAQLAWNGRLRSALRAAGILADESAG